MGADACLKKGASYFRFASGLREFASSVEDPQESQGLGQVRGIASMLGEEQFLELEAFGVCAPPAPDCDRSDWLELGWYFLRKHVLGLPLECLGCREEACACDRMPVPPTARADNDEDMARDEARAGGNRRPEKYSLPIKDSAPVPIVKRGEGTSFKFISRPPWEGADAILPDFDCYEVDSVNDMWDELRYFVGSVQLFEDTGSVRASGFTSEEEEIDTWERYANLFFRYQDAGAISSDDALAEECPFAFLALQMARWGVCLQARRAETVRRCRELQPKFSNAFFHPFGMKGPGVGMPLFLNSRWIEPICTLSAKYRRLVVGHDDSLDPNGIVAESSRCASEGTMRWGAYLEALVAQKTDFGQGSTINFALGAGVNKHAGDKIRECLLGYLSAQLEQLRLSQAAKTEEYGFFATASSELLADLDRAPYDQPTFPGSITLLMLTPWPIVPLLCSTAFQAQALKRVDMSAEGRRYGYQHKPYQLDFRPEEILRPPEETRGLSALRALPREQHLRVLRAARKRRISGCFRGLLASLETALTAPGSRQLAEAKVVYVSMIWGARLSTYLAPTLQRVQALGIVAGFLIWCLDDASCDACVEAHPFKSNCVRGRLKTIFNKFTVLSAIVNSGFDAVYVDFDTVFFKDPTPLLLEAAADAEVMVSRDFGSECLNTGVVYVKAHEDTAIFLSSLMAWLWRHPYEFSQKAFSGFLLHEILGHGPFALEVVRVPRWEVLDPLNAFVTNTVYHADVEGWTGEMENIAIYHFLDGTGGADENRAVYGRYVNLYDLFYANDRLNLSDTSVPLWVQDKEVEEALLRSRRPSPPETLYPCMMLPDA